MIIFVYWYLSVDDIEKDSNWRVVRSLIESLPADKYSWVISYPIYKSGAVKPQANFSNVIWYGVPMLKSRNNGVFNNNYLVFSKIAKQYPVHLIWNNLIEVTDVLKNTFSEPLFDVPICSTHHYVMHKSLGGLMYHRIVALRQILGAIITDYNLFSSAYSVKMLEETIKDVGVFGDVSLNGKYIPLMVIGDDFEQKDTRGGKIKLIYNHRLESYKNYQSTFQKLDALWKARGGDFEMFVTYGSTRESFVSRFKWAKSVDCATREDYFKLLHSCDFGVTESKHETFCISAVEAMTANVKMYMPDAITFREIADERAVLFQKDEWVAMLNQDMNNISTIRKEHATGDYRKKFGKAHLVQKWIGLFDEMMSKPINAKVDNIRNYLENNIKEGDYFAFYEKMTKDLGLGQQALPHFKLAKWLYSMGYDIRIIDNNFIIRTK